MVGKFSCWSSTCAQPDEQPVLSGDMEVPAWVAAVLLVAMVTWIGGPITAAVACLLGALCWLACREPRRPNGGGPPPNNDDWPVAF